MTDKKHTVLIIEDNEINREILGSILENDYRILTAENGKVGLEVMQQHLRDIDLVLLDIQMPVMNGYEVLEAVRQDKLLQEIPIIIATSNDRSNEEEHCLSLGATDFVSKPYNPTLVHLRVDTIIHLHESNRSNLQKTTFLQNMSHELRTPLNAMYGFAQLLGLPDGTWTEEEKEKYNQYITNSYNTMMMLLGDIFSTADSSHEAYPVKIAETKVNEVCQNALMSVEFRVYGGVDLKFTSDLSDDYLIHSDGLRIQQVLTNLLSNACKYTEKGSIRLHLSHTETPGQLTFTVTDTGIGIPADKAEMIFERFTKLDNYVQGSGLGLYICRLVATKLGGKVWLDTSYTEGARFKFTLENQ